MVSNRKKPKGRAPGLNEIKQLKPHPLQSRAFRAQEKFVGLACGRGSGKSLIAKYRIVRALAETVEHSRPIYFYLLPTEAQAKRIAWADLISMIPKEWIKKINATDKTIETHFGSVLYVLGGDKPARLEGVQWDGGIVDEACDYRPGVWDLTLLPALTHRCRFCFRIGVPKRFGSSSDEYHSWFMKPAPNKFCATWPSSDIVEASILAQLKEELASADYDEQFNATWVSARGGVFLEFSEAHNVYNKCHYTPSRPVIVGCDFNVDPMSWTLAHMVSGKVIAFDEIRISNTTTQRTLDELHRRYNDPIHKAGWIFTGDAASKQRHTNADVTDYMIINNDQRFENKSIEFPNSNPSLVSRFATTNAALRSADGKRHVFIHPRCEGLIKDLKSLAYKPHTHEVDLTNKTLGHSSDSFGYLLMLARPLPFLRQAEEKIYTGLYT